MNRIGKCFLALWSMPLTGIAAPTAPPGATSAELVWTGAALVVVIVAILALAQFAKRFGGLSLGVGQQLRVLAGIPVGARERVVLVQVGRKQLVLGVAPGRVDRLCELTGDDCVHAASSAGGSSFEQRLAALVRGSEHTG